MSLLDVEQTETVLTLLHVKTGNASILVHRETHVQEMLTVELSCINLYALAQMVILGIQELLVNYVSTTIIHSLWCFFNKKYTDSLFYEVSLEGNKSIKYGINII